MIELFKSAVQANILPCDGEVVYYGTVMNMSKAQYYFDQLLRTIAWQHDEAVVFGKRIVTPRKVAWYGDDNYAYTYSKVTKRALNWTPELLQLKNTVEEIVGSSFNSCLLNLYHSGDEGMAWHSDDEKNLGQHAKIASLSLGAQRKFAFKHKKKTWVVPIILEKGSLLLMKGTTQAHWLHRLPPTKKVKTPRINLTFRTILA